MAKILIVEDDEVLVKMYKRKLEHEGFEVVAGFSGSEGLDLAAKERPDLVLLDIMMPGIDGFQVLKALKMDPDTRPIPVIILTNLGTSDVFLEEAKRWGAAEYLVKYKTSANEVIDSIKRELAKEA